MEPAEWRPGAEVRGPRRCHQRRQVHRRQDCLRRCQRSGQNLELGKYPYPSISYNSLWLGMALSANLTRLAKLAKSSVREISSMYTTVMELPKKFNYVIC